MHKKSPSKIWRKFKSRYLLIGSKSKKTDKAYYPPVFVEPENSNTEFEAYRFENEAKLITWSEVNAPPAGFEDMKPYIVGILEFKNGERITTQIVDVDYNKLQKGDVFIPTFRKYFEDGKDGIIHYGLKWTKV
ncbi:transcriptional regulator [Candidatus Dojkabacteria bacterium]|nr:transcriptional regulator [Candidatus Dojkabacteria bacterium]